MQGLYGFEVWDPSGEECFKGACCNHAVKTPKLDPQGLIEARFSIVIDGSSFCGVFLQKRAL